MNTKEIAVEPLMSPGLLVLAWQMVVRRQKAEVKPDGRPVVTVFKRRFVRGPLKGIVHPDSIPHVDRWHALQWVRGVRANSRKGVLEYDLIKSQTFYR